MRKKILIGVPVALLLIVAVFASVVAMQPNEFKVIRSARIAAPPEKVFEHVNDLHKWNAWSPWIELDPNAKTTFAGPTSGKGAKFSWDGNDNMGAGSMTILDSRPPTSINMELVFTRPAQTPALIDFTFQPVREETEVTWTMSGHHNFVEKAVCMCMNMDKMVGGSFEKGLANIKRIVEAESAEMPLEESANKDAEATDPAK